MSAQAAVLQVVILRDGLLVGTEVFVPGQYVIGSGADADLRLDDATVEARHATLYFQNGRAAIQDQHSRLGLYVNGSRVQACEVRPLDEVICGPFVLKVRTLSQQGQAQPHAPPEVADLLRPPAAPASVAPAIPPNTAPSVRSPLRPKPADAPHLSVGARATQASAITVPASPAPAAMARPKDLGTVPSVRKSAQLRQTAAAAAQPATPPPAPAPAPLQTPHLRALTPLPFDLDELTEELFDAEKPQRPAATPKAPLLPTSGKDVSRRAPRLFLELHWGNAQQAVREFKSKKPLLAAASDQAPFPLWGFGLPDDAPFPLAQKASKSRFHLFIPPKTKVERRDTNGHYHPVAQAELQASGPQPFLTVENGGALRLTHGAMTLLAYVAPPPKLPWANPFSQAPWLALFFLAVFGAAFGWFVHRLPARMEATFTSKNIAPVAVRLLAPEPKKKEQAQKKLAAIKQKAEAAKPKAEKAARKVEKSVPKAAQKAPQTQALKALAKLTSAGPASGDILSAMDKMGPKTNRKDSSLQLSGLLGKGQVANSGLGQLGATRGGGTKGSELLRGGGAGGIGALGLGNVGKGSVGGTVSKASGRTIAMGKSPGSIDREAVAKTVNSHLQEVRACYERALLRDPGLAGKVVLEWNISTSGDVVSARTKTSTLNNAAVEGCILTSLKKWKFPKAKGGVVIVSYPFLFNSVGY